MKPFPLLILILLPVSPSARAQLPTNNLASAGSAVTVNTGGALLSPTNFFDVNSSRLKTASEKFATNVVTSGAAYDDGNQPFSSDLGSPAYAVPVAIGSTYFVFVPGEGSGNDQGFVNPDFSHLQTGSGLITANSNVLYLFDNNPGTAVGSSVYLVNTNSVTGGFFAGNSYGTFRGTVNIGSTVPDSVLSGDVQLQTNRLEAFANGGKENYIMSTNTANGSTLAIFRVGNSATDGGYADVGFYTATSRTQISSGGQKLYWALGVANNPANFPYGQPFIESYLNQYPVYYVGASQIFGGFYNRTPTSSDGNWVWYWGGNTNTPMVMWDRASRTLSNYCQATFESNITLHGSAALVAPNANVVTANVNTLKATNGISYSSTAQATSYAIATTDNLVLLTASGQTATLPAAAGAAGHVFTIKLTASGSGTVATTSSQDIDGATTYSLSAQYKYVSVQSDGTQWWIIANN